MAPHVHPNNLDNLYSSYALCSHTWAQDFMYWVSRYFHNLNVCKKYTPQKMFLLAFSFANFETTRGNTRKDNIYTAQKQVSPQFSKFANEKVRRNFIWGVYSGARGWEDIVLSYAS